MHSEKSVYFWRRLLRYGSAALLLRPVATRWRWTRRGGGRRGWRMDEDEERVGEGGREANTRRSAGRGERSTREEEGVEREKAKTSKGGRKGRIRGGAGTYSKAMRGSDGERTAAAGEDKLPTREMGNQRRGGRLCTKEARMRQECGEWGKGAGTGGRRAYGGGVEETTGRVKDRKVGRTDEKEEGRRGGGEECAASAERRRVQRWRGDGRTVDGGEGRVQEGSSIRGTEEGKIEGMGRGTSRPRKKAENEAREEPPRRWTRRGTRSGSASLRGKTVRGTGTRSGSDEKDEDQDEENGGSEDLCAIWQGTSQTSRATLGDGDDGATPSASAVVCVCEKEEVSQEIIQGTKEEAYLERFHVIASAAGGDRSKAQRPATRAAAAVSQSSVEGIRVDQPGRVEGVCRFTSCSREPQCKCSSAQSASLPESPAQCPPAAAPQREGNAERLADMRHAYDVRDVPWAGYDGRAALANSRGGVSRSTAAPCVCGCGVAVVSLCACIIRATTQASGRIRGGSPPGGRAGCSGTEGKENNREEDGREREEGMAKDIVQVRKSGGGKRRREREGKEGRREGKGGRKKGRRGKSGENEGIRRNEEDERVREAEGEGEVARREDSLCEEERKAHLRLKLSHAPALDPHYPMFVLASEHGIVEPAKETAGSRVLAPEANGALASEGGSGRRAEDEFDNQLNHRRSRQRGSFVAMHSAHQFSVPVRTPDPSFLPRPWAMGHCEVPTDQPRTLEPTFERKSSTGEYLFAAFKAHASVQLPVIQVD
ncbi:hypothetical protein DFH06DRAFT_1132077 [Mycena polygramma]|nr:hypothetical protein DFH06DRAFT_1132077 [Mycena polygramma]